MTEDSMSHHDPHDLLAAWAIDAVDPDERAAVERAIAEDPALAEEAAGFLATAAVLGAARAVTPPTQVRDRVLAAIRTDATTTQAAATHLPAASPGTRSPRGRDGATRPGSTRPGTARSDATGPGSRRGLSRRLRTVLVAAVLAVAIALPSVSAWQQHQRAVQAEARADRITALLASPDAQLLSGDLSSGGTATAVVTADAALVTAEGVSDPGDGKVYQLWVMRDGVPVPDATTGVSGDAFQIDTTAYRAGDGLALTVEPTGGSQAPTTDPLLVLAPTV
ncbi:anti-sigma factor domain-containing protein [Cellulomonas taurus]|uniref:anti-sigma factor n=1 Tax=Cellulomonas taurus TaxID=2729175 RepID=UPI00145D26A8|nr:anti-sigma factor [Cellulomonas taurus]